MPEKNRPRRAYLIRCWQEPILPHKQAVWRFSVEEVLYERQRRGFASLPALLAFLQAEFADDEYEFFAK